MTVSLTVSHQWTWINQWGVPSITVSPLAIGKVLILPMQYLSSLLFIFYLQNKTLVNLGELYNSSKMFFILRDSNLGPHALQVNEPLTYNVYWTIQCQVKITYFKIFLVQISLYLLCISTVLCPGFKCTKNVDLFWIQIR